MLRPFKPGFSVGDGFSAGLFLASGAPLEPVEARGSPYSTTGRFWGSFGGILANLKIGILLEGAIEVNGNGCGLRGWWGMGYVSLSERVCLGGYRG